MLLVQIRAYGGNLKYYGGYTSNPSNYPPPQANYEPLTDNTDSTKYLTVQGKTIYNSAVLVSGNKAYLSLIFDHSCLIRGYYDNSAWSSVDARTQYGTCYSVAGGWRTVVVGGVSIPCISTGIPDSDSYISSDLPVFTNPNEYLEYITSLAQLYTWTSVPSVSGKNGILSLSHVADDSILTGDALTNIGMDAVVLPSSAKFENMMANVPHGTRAPIVCAGQIDHLDAKWSAFIGGGYDLMLNMGNSSTDAYRSEFALPEYQRCCPD